MCPNCPQFQHDAKSSQDSTNINYKITIDTFSVSVDDGFKLDRYCEVIGYITPLSIYNLHVAFDEI